MPYVEGFGTYPFGEEWLFDAVCRCYLRLLAVLEQVTVSVTPVLADQLEVAALGERLLGFVREFRIATAEREAERRRSGRSRRLPRRGERVPPRPRAPGALRRRIARSVPEAEGEGRVELWTSAATHAVLPLVATDAGRAAADRRRAALPPPALRRARRLLAAGVRVRARPRATCSPSSASTSSASTRSRRAAGGGAARRSRPPRGRSRCRSTGRRSPGSGRSRAIPPIPGYCDFPRALAAGVRAWTIAGEPYDPEAAAASRARAGARVRRGDRRASAGPPRADGRPGLLTFAVDTELLGHWWWEGPTGWRRSSSGRPARGPRWSRSPRRWSEHEPERPGRWSARAGARARTCAPGIRPGRRPGLGRAAARAAGARASSRRRGSPEPVADARRARAARGAGQRLGLPRRRAGRRATTPSSGPPAMPARCSRP